MKRATRTVQPPGMEYTFFSSPICWSVSQNAASRAPMTRLSSDMLLVGVHMLCWCSEPSVSGCPACLAETSWGPTLSSRACQRDSNERRASDLGLCDKTTKNSLSLKRFDLYGLPKVVTGCNSTASPSVPVKDGEHGVGHIHQPPAHHHPYTALSGHSLVLVVPRFPRVDSFCIAGGPREDRHISWHNNGAHCMIRSHLGDQNLSHKYTWKNITNTIVKMSQIHFLKITCISSSVASFRKAGRW